MSRNIEAAEVPMEDKWQGWLFVMARVEPASPKGKLQETVTVRKLLRAMISVEFHSELPRTHMFLAVPDGDPVTSMRSTWRHVEALPSITLVPVKASAIIGKRLDPLADGRDDEFLEVRANTMPIRPHSSPLGSRQFSLLR